MTQERLFSTLLALIVTSFLISCEKEQDSTAGGLVNSASNGKATTTETVAATGDTSAASTEGAAAKVPETTPTEVPAAAITPEEIITPETTVDKLKKIASSLSLDQLTTLADGLTKVIQEKTGAVDDATAKVKEVSSSVLNDLGSLKESASKTLEVGSALVDKLRVTVDELKAKGADVTKYLQTLGGE